MLLDLTVASLDYLEQLSALMRDPIFYGSVGASRGRGQPVVLLPGYFASDWAMAPMAGWLRRIGYRPYLSGIELNVGCPRIQLERPEARVAAIVRDHANGVVLIGHSLGGVFARALGVALPGAVTRVIGLGAPIRQDWEAINGRIGSFLQGAARLWQALAGAPVDCGTMRCECGFARAMTPASSRAGRFSSIHSIEDEVVDWRSCRDVAGDNFQVRGGHAGLTVNREVYRLIVRILAGPIRLPALADPAASL